MQDIRQVVAEAEERQRQVRADYSKAAAEATRVAEDLERVRAHREQLKKQRAAAVGNPKKRATASGLDAALTEARRDAGSLEANLDEIGDRMAELADEVRLADAVVDDIKAYGERYRAMQAYQETVALWTELETAMSEVKAALRSSDAVGRMAPAAVPKAVDLVLTQGPKMRRHAATTAAAQGETYLARARRCLDAWLPDAPGGNYDGPVASAPKAQAAEPEPEFVAEV